MGNYKSKNEEIIIAQQGANNARQVGDMEKKMEIFGIIVIFVAIALIFFCIWVCGRRCCTSARKLIRKELTSLWPAGPSMQPTAAQAQACYENPC